MVATFVVALPAVFVNTARACQPFSNAVSGPEVTVSPLKGPTSIHVDPPSTESCQSTVGVGAPMAATVNVAVPPEKTLWLSGSVVTTGAGG